MSTNDPGLPDAVHWVREAIEVHSRCDCLDPDVGAAEWEEHVEYHAARAAREDVPDLIRQAKADALEDFAHNHVLNQTPGRMAEDLLGRAAKIREGA